MRRRAGPSWPCTRRRCRGSSTTSGPRRGCGTRSRPTRGPSPPGPAPGDRAGVRAPAAGYEPPRHLRRARRRRWRGRGAGGGGGVRRGAACSRPAVADRVGDDDGTELVAADLPVGTIAAETAPSRPGRGRRRRLVRRVRAATPAAGRAGVPAVVARRARARVAGRARRRRPTRTSASRLPASTAEVAISEEPASRSPQPTGPIVGTGALAPPDTRRPPRRRLADRRIRRRDRPSVIRTAGPATDDGAMAHDADPAPPRAVASGHCPATAGAPGRLDRSGATVGRRSPPPARPSPRRPWRAGARPALALGGRRAGRRARRRAAVAGRGGGHRGHRPGAEAGRALRHRDLRQRTTSWRWSSASWRSPPCSASSSGSLARRRPLVGTAGLGRVRSASGVARVARDARTPPRSPPCRAWPPAAGALRPRVLRPRRRPRIARRSRPTPRRRRRPP